MSEKVKTSLLWGIQDKTEHCPPPQSPYTSIPPHVLQHIWNILQNKSEDSVTCFFSIPRGFHLVNKNNPEGIALLTSCCNERKWLLTGGKQELLLFPKQRNTNEKCLNKIPLWNVKRCIAWLTLLSTLTPAMLVKFELGQYRSVTRTQNQAFNILYGPCCNMRQSEARLTLKQVGSSPLR